MIWHHRISKHPRTHQAPRDAPWRAPMIATVSLAASAPLALALALASPPAAAEPDGAGDDAPAAGDPEPEDTDTGAPESDEPGIDDPAPGDRDGDGAPDVDDLRREYLDLRDRLFRSQARADAVSRALYGTELRVHLDFPSDRFVAPSDAAIRLNGATVYEDDDGDITEPGPPRFEGHVAPGPHRITVAIAAASRDDPRFEAESEHTFTIVAPRGERVIVRAEAGDDGDIGYEWGESRSGNYDLGLEVDVETEALPGVSAAEP